MPIYMKIDGIDGDVTAAGHEKWIEIYSYSLGASNTLSSGGGGGGGGGVTSFSDFNILKPTAKASPSLFLACCTGRHFPKATIELTRPSPGRGDHVYLKYELQNVIVTSYQPSGDSGGSVPTESLSLNYARIKYTQSITGGVEEMHWDIPSNSGGGGQ